MRLRKTIAAMLAILVIATILPLSAFARTYLVIRGTISSTQSNYYLVNVRGTDQVFYFDQNTRFGDDFYQAGDEVRVVVDAADPTTMLQIKMTRPGYTPPKVSHSHYSVTGPITDAGMSSITILYKGSYRTFGKEDADVLNAPDGILLGDIVKIVYSADDPQTAIQIILVSHGDNHENHLHSVQSVSHYSVTGPIVNAGMSSITIMYQGQYRTFGKEDAKVVGADDGIALGDFVKILYTSDDPSTAVEIRMVREGDNH